LLAWLIGAMFDTYNLNGQLLGMVGFVLAATLPCRPTLRLRVAAREPSCDPAVDQPSASADPAMR